MFDMVVDKISFLHFMLEQHLILILIFPSSSYHHLPSFVSAQFSLSILSSFIYKRVYIFYSRHQSIYLQIFLSLKSIKYHHWTRHCTRSWFSFIQRQQRNNLLIELLSMYTKWLTHTMNRSMTPTLYLEPITYAN